MENAEEKRFKRQEVEATQAAQDFAPDPADQFMALEIQKGVQRQEKLMEKTLAHTRIRTVITAVVALVLILTAFSATRAFDEISKLARDTSKVVYNVEGMVEDLRLEDTITGINRLVSDGSLQMDDAMGQVKDTLDGFASIDFEALNASIERLDKVSSMMGSLFGIN